MAVLISNPTVAFCSHPIEGLRMIRKRRKDGNPMPEVLMIKDPQCEKLLKNLQLRVEKLAGKQNCPNLVIVPTRDLK